MALNIANFTKFKNFVDNHPLTNDIWLVGYDHDVHGTDPADIEVRVELSEVINYIRQNGGTGFSLWRVTIPADEQAWQFDDTDGIYKCTFSSLTPASIEWWDPTNSPNPVFKTHTEFTNDPSMFCDFINASGSVIDVSYDDSVVTKYSKMMESGMFGVYNSGVLTLCSINNPDDARFANNTVSFLIKIFSNITNPNIQ